MRSKLVIQGIDAHTEGCPIRVITAGAGLIRGATMVERRASLMARDEFRRLVIFEPRGSFNMPAAVLTEPCSAQADLGMIILEPDTYPPMCGHCAIGVATVAIETGLVAVAEGANTVRLDTPAGVVPATVQVEQGRAKGVTLTMPASFCYRREALLLTERFGTVAATIAFGGDFYAIVQAAELGLSLERENAWDIVAAAKDIRKALTAIPVQHPAQAHINSIYQVMLVGPPHGAGADGRNVVVCPPQVIDRSPCGTGTAARMAALFAAGRLRVGERFVHEGILDTVMVGEITGATRIGELAGIECSVTARAYITGSFNFYLDPEDPFPAGFRLTGV